MDTLHPVMQAALAAHLAIPSMLAAATVYRPGANRLREYASRAEAEAYDLAAECYPAHVFGLSPALRSAASDAWHDMDRRRVELDEQRADEVHELRERGLL